jgi:hypothetical protein
VKFDVALRPQEPLVDEAKYIIIGIFDKHHYLARLASTLVLRKLPEQPYTHFLGNRIDTQSQKMIISFTLYLAGLRKSRLLDPPARPITLPTTESKGEHDEASSRFIALYLCRCITMLLLLDPGRETSAGVGLREGGDHRHP